MRLAAGVPRLVAPPEVAALGAAAIALTLFACSKPPPPPPPPPDVVVAEVIQKDVPIYAEWVGTTEGNITAQIRARVQGYLQQRSYQEGTLVRAGDLLFLIDPRPYQAALDQAKGDLGRAEATRTKTEQDVTRYTPLAAEKAISQEELDNAIQASRAAKAAVDSARAAVEKAQLNLDWTQIKSPDRRHRGHRRRTNRRSRQREHAAHDGVAGRPDQGLVPDQRAGVPEVRGPNRPQQAASRRRRRST